MQNCGDTHDARFSVVQSVFVCVIVWLPLPVHAQLSVHETESVTPTPPLHCALPPAPVQLAVYVVVCDGETEVLPDVGEPLPVEKFVPVHDVAFADVHVRVELLPCVTDVGSKESVHIGPTAQLEYAYVPPSVPFEHARVSETQLDPYGTVAA